jgi:hypothetical protein
MDLPKRRNRRNDCERQAQWDRIGQYNINNSLLVCCNGLRMKSSMMQLMTINIKSWYLYGKENYPLKTKALAADGK